MKFLIQIVLSVLLCQSVFANDFAIEFGTLQHSVDAAATNATTKSGMGLQFGATANMQMKDRLYFRTGMLYTQRPFSVVISNTEYKINANYLDIPLAIMFKFEDYAGVFLGVDVALNLDSSVSPSMGSALGTKSSLTPIIFGVNFKMAPQIGGTLYYQTASGDLAQGYGQSRAVGVNLMFTFE